MKTDASEKEKSVSLLAKDLKRKGQTRRRPGKDRLPEARSRVGGARVGERRHRGRGGKRENGKETGKIGNEK